MSEIVWEEPERLGGRADGSSRGIWIKRLAPLLKHRGRWAMVIEKENIQQASRTAVNLRKGIVVAPPGKWEFASRTVNGKGRVYARYLGPEE